MPEYFAKQHEPIVTSLLQCDLYKFSMLFFYLNNFPSIRARYDLKVRSDFSFAPYLEEIQEQIHFLCQLRFTEDEIAYLRSIRYFKEHNINDLRGFSLNPDYVRVYVDDDGKFQCYSEGPISQASMYEIYILEILQEIYGREKLRDADFEKGKRILSDNIRQVQEFTETQPFSFSDFSCRRAASLRWLDYVLETASEKLNRKVFSGTSCVYFARKHNLLPIGTMAHEVMELGQAVVHPFDSQEFIFEKWAHEYRGDLGIALSDTFGGEYFVKKAFHKGFALQFNGVRHDSGDPVRFGEMILDMYRKYGIDPMTKLIVFSDQLSFEKAFGIARHFRGIIQTSFGIGTEFGNAMGVPALQIVMKMTEADGKPVAKISDSTGKGMCRDATYEKFLRNHIRAVIAGE